MGRKAKDEKTTYVRCPISTRDVINQRAKDAGISAPDFLKKVFGPEKVKEASG